MIAEIITSGTELLLGEVVDTNTPFLARELAAFGIHVYHHTTVGDNPERLLNAIQIAEERADIVIISGGLGPTEDDITKNILAEHLGTELMIDEESFEKATKRYQADELPKGNYRQAMVLKGSTPLKNDIGMAAGIFMEQGMHKYALLPGVPSEFEHMVIHHLLPLLAKFSHEDHILHSRNLNFYGLPEAKVAEELSEIIGSQTNPTIAIYAKNGVIDIRLTASAKTVEECKLLLDEMEERVLRILNSHFFGYNSTRLQDVIFDTLAANGESLSIIEIQTDGEVIDGLAHNISNKNAFKGGLYFTQVDNAKAYFDLEETSTLKEENESFAKRALEHFNSDYGVAVMGIGENKVSYSRMPEMVYISLMKADGSIYTTEFDLGKRTYFARWLVTLRVSDLIRRALLDLPDLEDNY